MSTLLGELIGRVDAAGGVREHAVCSDDAGEVTEKQQALVAEINRVVDPPVAVSVEDVFIRSMDVVSDEVNEHGGRFSPGEFGRLCELIVDSPVLIAHDKRQLPVGRNFKAEVIDRDGRPWVKVWFYWPRDTAAAQDLASRIDAGVIQEVSIGFEFKRPECSVCGRDIRECDHRPFVEYEHADGVKSPAHYIYREIVRVLETSLVYRGATPGTRIGAGLFFGKSETPADDNADTPELSPPTDASTATARFLDSLFEVGLANATPVRSALDLPSGESRPERYVVSPLVNGLPVAVLKRDGEVFIFDPDRREISAKLPAICRTLKQKTPDDFAAVGWLTRPPKRAKFSDITFFVDWLGDPSDATIERKSVIEHRRRIAQLFPNERTVRAMPYRWSDRSGLTRAVQLISSPDGCRIYAAEEAVSSRLPGYELRRKPYLWTRITERTALDDGKWAYRVALDDGEELCDIAEPIVSAQRYPIGRVAPVSGAVRFVGDSTVEFIEPSIPFTLARRDGPDSLAAVRALCESGSGNHKQGNRAASMS